MVLCVPAKEAYDYGKGTERPVQRRSIPLRPPMPKGSEMYKLSTRLCKCGETLAQGLDEPAKAQLEVLTRTQWELNCLTAEENFILGFRLGVQVMVECLGGEPDG